MFHKVEHENFGFLHPKTVVWRMLTIWIVWCGGRGDLKVIFLWSISSLAQGGGASIKAGAIIKMPTVCVKMI